MEGIEFRQNYYREAQPWAGVSTLRYKPVRCCITILHLPSLSSVSSSYQGELIYYYYTLPEVSSVPALVILYTIWDLDLRIY